MKLSAAAKTSISLCFHSKWFNWTESNKKTEKSWAAWRKDKKVAEISNFGWVKGKGKKKRRDNRMKTVNFNLNKIKEKSCLVIENH